MEVAAVAEKLQVQELRTACLTRMLQYKWQDHRQQLSQLSTHFVVDLMLLAETK